MDLRMAWQEYAKETLHQDAKRWLAFHSHGMSCCSNLLYMLYIVPIPFLFHMGLHRCWFDFNLRTSQLFTLEVRGMLGATLFGLVPLYIMQTNLVIIYIFFTSPHQIKSGCRVLVGSWRSTCKLTHETKNLSISASISDWSWLKGCDGAKYQIVVRSMKIGTMRFSKKTWKLLQSCYSPPGSEGL